MKNADQTVTITHYDCTQCELTTSLTHHQDRSCEGPVLCVGDEWLCGSCGCTIDPVDECFQCEATSELQKLAVPIDISPQVSPSAIEAAVHEKTNDERIRKNLGSLDYSSHLSAIALQHSRHMAIHDKFDHESVDGDRAQDRYEAYGHDTSSVGENIAFRQPHASASPSEIARSVVDGWMDSTGHRENILRDRFEEEGIGVYMLPDRTVYVTQNFY